MSFAPSFLFFLPSSSSSPLLPRLRRHPRRPLRQMSPDVNMDLQTAVGSAGPQPGSSGADWATPDLTRRALERTGQRRTSPGELWSGLGNAGPHPGSSRAEWAAPDLSCQKICQKMSEICQKRMSEEMSEKNVRKNVRRNIRRNVRRYVKRYVRKNVRQECQKICQKKYQKICQ